MKITGSQLRRVIREGIERYSPEFMPGEKGRLGNIISKLMVPIEEAIKDCPEVKDFREALSYGFAGDQIIKRASPCIPRSMSQYRAIAQILMRVWQRWNEESGEDLPFFTVEQLDDLTRPTPFLNKHFEMSIVAGPTAWSTRAKGYVPREDMMLDNLQKCWMIVRELERKDLTDTGE